MINGHPSQAVVRVAEPVLAGEGEIMNGLGVRRAEGLSDGIIGIDVIRGHIVRPGSPIVGEIVFAMYPERIGGGDIVEGQLDESGRSGCDAIARAGVTEARGAP